MKVPEPLFVIINPIVKMLLRSPAHGILSSSIMIVTFTGRRSGREFSTPARYLRDGDRIRAFSTMDTQWWRNLRDGAVVRIRAAGQEAAYRTHVLENNPAVIREQLREYLGRHPEDAVYHHIRLNHDDSIPEAELEQAAQHAVVIEALPVGPEVTEPRL